MEPAPLPIRAVSFLKQAIGHVLFRIKRALGLLAKSVKRDELRELTNEARVLGSASAESINHVGAELRELNERLSRLERDVERIARVLEDKGAGDPVLEKHTEAAAESLSTD